MTQSSLPRLQSIAIDGPAGSGKSTLGRALAQRLGFLYFDTGVMYRAVALAALERGSAKDDENAISQLAETLVIEVLPPDAEDGRAYTVRIDSRDVTWALRAPEVEAIVGVVSTYPRVRTALVRQQRRIAQRGAVVMVGRDIGTVVLPEADFKIYLDASPEVRAERRVRELRARNIQADYQAVLANLRQRDYLDTHRTDSPLRPAHDAVIVDSTHMDAEDTLDYVWRLLMERAALHFGR